MGKGAPARQRATPVPNYRQGRTTRQADLPSARRRGGRRTFRGRAVIPRPGRDGCFRRRIVRFSGQPLEAGPGAGTKPVANPRRWFFMFLATRSVDPAVRGRPGLTGRPCGPSGRFQPPPTPTLPGRRRRKRQGPVFDFPYWLAGRGAAASRRGPFQRRVRPHSQRA